MAGHSQFKNIMHRKGRQDAQKSKLFSKLAREITVAAKMGAPDPGMNARLRAAIISARQENMSKESIERAVKKATDPVSPRLPPDLVKNDRMSEAARLRLSVSASTITATPPGP